MLEPGRIYDVVIVGGGFSGTLLAVNLLKKSSGRIAIAVIDRADRQGRGVAYGTDCQAHLLNVAAGKMSVMPEQPDHFLRWLNCERGLSAAAGHFVPRRFYGEYLEHILKCTLEEFPSADFTWISSEVCSLEEEAGKPLVNLRTGVRIPAEIVVLATGNAPPCDPPQLRKLDSRFYVSYAWAKDALDRIPRQGAVLLAGSGLTAIDQVLALRARNFEGNIFMLSRHGKAPVAHTSSSPWPSDWTDSLPNSARSILRAVREQIDFAAISGVDWRSVIDSMRPATSRIWRGLSVPERRRFLRHIRPFWEIVRHRMPSEVHSIMKEQLKSGALQLLAGRLLEIEEHDQQVEVKIRLRSGGVERTLRVDCIINCTGPGTSLRTLDALFHNLVQNGIARIDPLDIGIETTPDGSIISASGKASDSLYTLGPVRKAALWETTAVPEIRAQVEQLSNHLAKTFQKASLAAS